MRLKASQGFSIVELMIVVAIVGILGTLTAVQFSGTGQVSQVRDAARLVTADLQRAQSWAQTGKTCCSSVVPNGYGVIFDHNQDTYILYAEFSGNKQYDLSSSDVAVSTIDLGTSELLIRSAFGSGGTADSILFQTCAPLSATSTCEVFFSYPSGVVYTNGAQTTNFSLTIAHTQRSISSSVSVNVTSGKIN